MSEFKVGDKVVCVDPNHRLLSGETYTVKSLDSDGLVSVEGIHERFFPFRFQKIVYTTLQKEIEDLNTMGYR